MLGNTNIKDGVALNANIAEKKVTGSGIVAGDFVEFTGNTENTYTASINMDYSTSFKISDTKAGFAFYDENSSYIRFLIISACVVVNDVTVSMPEVMSNTNLFDLYVDFYNNKLYVHCSKIIPHSIDTPFDVSVYVFNFDNSTNGITYSTKITYTLPNDKTYSSSYPYAFDYKHFFANGLMFVVCMVSISNSTSGTPKQVRGFPCIYRFDNSGNLDCYRVFSELHYSHSSADNSVYVDAENIYITDPYTSGSFTFRYIYEYYNDNNFDQKRSWVRDAANVPEPFKVYKDNAKNIMAFVWCNNSNNTFNINFFSKTEGESKTTVSISEAINTYPIYEIRQYKEVGNKVYFIAVINAKYGTTQKYIVVTIEYDYVNYIASVKSIYTSQSNIFSDVTILLNGNTEFYFAKDSAAYGIVGIINNDVYVPSTTIDLVKKYENRIDGVAKQNGNPGETIEIYTPI